MAASVAAPRAVLWDMDGTLVDSAEYHYQAWPHLDADRVVASLTELAPDAFEQLLHRSAT